MSPTARGAGFTSQSPSVRRLRMRAGTPAPDQIDQVEGMPSPHAGGDARAGSDRPGQGNAVSACGRGRPRTQDARGSIILPIALSGENARAPQGLPRAQGGLQPARAAVVRGGSTALSGENAIAPQGLPRTQGGLQPARAAVVRGGSTSMRTAIILNLHHFGRRVGRAMMTAVVRGVFNPVQ